MNERAASFWLVHAVVVLACIAGAGLASAQHGGQWSRAISVRGGSSCVSASALRGRIARYLARGAPPAELAIEVNLAGDPPNFRVLQAGSAVAERRFDRLPAGCAERRDAIALTIAVAIEHALPVERSASGAPAPPNTGGPPSQPSAAEARSATSPAAATPATSGTRATPAEAAATQVTPQPAAAATQRAAEPEPEPEPELSSSYADNLPSGAAWLRPTQRWMLHAGAAYLVQALPSPAPVFTLGAEFAVFPAFRIGLSGLVSANATTADFPPGRVESQLFGGQAFACLNTPFFAVIVHGCAGAASALVKAEGFDYPDSTPARMAWLAGVLRLVFEVPATGAVAVRLTGAGHVNLVRPRLVLERESIEDQDETRSVEPLGASFGAEFLVRID